MLGNVKLHKALYYADFLTYLATMKPLTGADYQRQKFGPTARHLSAALLELQDEGRVSVHARDYFGYPKKVYQSRLLPQTNRLTDAERATIIEVLAFVCGLTASEISDFSHDEVWSSVRMGERIPYYASFALIPVEISDDLITPSSPLAF